MRNRGGEINDGRENIAAEMDHKTTSTKRGRRSVETKSLDESSKRENQLVAKRKQKGGGGSQAQPTSLDGALSKRGDGWYMEPKVTRRRLFFFRTTVNYPINKRYYGQ